MNIYVGNLSRTVTEDSLKSLFAGFGSVTSVRIIKDKFSGESRGFGFVDMPEKSEADTAITQLNGAEFEGMRLKVNEARQPEQRPMGGGNRGRSGGFGGRSSGGFGGRSGGGYGNRGGSQGGDY